MAEELEKDAQAKRGSRRKRAPHRQTKDDGLTEKTIVINRVAKVVKGGRRFSFAALVVVGDGNGNVGVGYGKGREVPMAVSKATNVAKKSIFLVPRIEGTIPHPIKGKDSAGMVYLRPAAPGTGVIAGGPVRAILESAGISDVLTKSLGSSNTLNIVRATVDALKGLQNPVHVAARRELSLHEVAPKYMADAILTRSPKVEAEAPAEVVAVDVPAVETVAEVAEAPAPAESVEAVIEEVRAEAEVAEATVKAEAVEATVDEARAEAEVAVDEAPAESVDEVVEVEAPVEAVTEAAVDAPAVEDAETEVVEAKTPKTTKTTKTAKATKAAKTTKSKAAEGDKVESEEK